MGAYGKDHCSRKGAKEDAKKINSNLCGFSFAPLRENAFARSLVRRGAARWRRKSYLDAAILSLTGDGGIWGQRV